MWDRVTNKLILCKFCKKEIKGFKDALSIKEFSISGLCQECQDKVFIENEEIWMPWLNQI